MDDFVFTFDVNPFMSAIDQISKGFEVLKESVKGFDHTSKQEADQAASHTAKVVKNNTKELKKHTEVSISNFSDNASKMINKLITRIAALGSAYLGFRALLKYIPEIGTAFQSMSKIFLNNFLWPLRQYLLPLLQKMLGWVRDNRAMFAKWGTVLVNAFKTVHEIVKGLFGVVKSFLSGFSDTFKRLFGTTVKSISDIINILMFKITVVAQFLISVLKPVFEKIGEWVAVAVKAISQFVKGISQGFGKITEPFGLIRDLLRDIVTDLSGSTEKTMNWAEGFRKAGLIVGGVLRTLVSGVTEAIDVMYMLMQTLSQAIKFTSMFFSGASAEDFKKQWKEAGNIYGKFFDRMKNYGKDVAKTWENIGENWNLPKDRITEKETVITTNPIKEVNKKGNIINSNVKVGDVRVYVTTPDKAEEVGRKVGKGLSSSIYLQMKKNSNDAMLGVSNQ